MVFFTDTNGGDDPTPSNPLSSHYAPLQQLLIDLANDTVADYNWITPDQYNDMHSALAGGYKGLTGDAARIRQGDDFLSQIVPVIMASNAYKNQGVIIIWWDESESDGRRATTPDDFDHTIGEIIISPRAHRNVNGLPYASRLAYTHSSDLRTMQEIFHVGPFLGDASSATDLSDLFESGRHPPKAAGNRSKSLTQLERPADNHGARTRLKFQTQHKLDLPGQSRSSVRRRVVVVVVVEVHCAGNYAEARLRIQKAS